MIDEGKLIDWVRKEQTYARRQFIAAQENRKHARSETSVGLWHTASTGWLSCISTLNRIEREINLQAKEVTSSTPQEPQEAP